MKNEVLEELWKVKDQMFEDANFDLKTLVKQLKKKELQEKRTVVDFSTETSSKPQKSKKRTGT